MLVLVLGIGVTLLTTRQILIHQMDGRIERQLNREAQELRGLAGDVDPATGKPFAGRLRPLLSTFMRRNVLAPTEHLITFVDGRPFLAKEATDIPDREEATEEALTEEFGRPLIAAWRSPSSSRSGTAPSASGEMRYLVVPIRANDRVRGSFVVTHLVDPERAEIDDTVRIAGLIGLIALALSALAAYLAAGRVLQPLRGLTETARSIEESDLTRRITVQGDDELAELGRTFNAMLDRLEGAFSSQRELIRSVNHELRTPLTIVRGHLELIGEDPAEVKETIELVTDELDRMALIVDDLLTLARSEREDFVVPEPTPIHPLLDEILTKAAALGERAWRLDVPVDPGVARIDPRRLTQAMLNLVDNAVRQTDPGQAIAIGAAREGNDILFRVDDDGPGITPGDEDRLFERFERGRSGRRYTGSGLGLAITKAIAEAHGGHVTAEGGPLGGARFTIRIPDPEGRPAAPGAPGREDETVELPR